MTVVEACCLPSVEFSVGCPYQKVAMVSMKPLFFRNLSQRAHNKRWHRRQFKLECFSSFVFSPTISETFGTSAEILSAMSWQRLCPLVQRSWQPASPRCCCNPWHGTCSPTSWRRRISSEENQDSQHEVNWRISSASLSRTHQGLSRAKASANLLFKKSCRAQEQSFRALSNSMTGDLNEPTTIYSPARLVHFLSVSIVIAHHRLKWIIPCTVLNRNKNDKIMK